jgi:hypothetical protein
VESEEVAYETITNQTTFTGNRPVSHPLLLFYFFILFLKIKIKEKRRGMNDGNMKKNQEK